jgi:hypothetical protein
MLHRKTLTLVVLVASFALLAPSAFARPGHHGPSANGERAGNASFDRRDVPSRVSSRLKRAARSLDRAEERVDDGETAGAISSLSSVRKNLASAQKSGNKRVSSNADNGPAAAWALTNAQHKVVDATAALFDGVTDPALAGAIEETLDAALTGRDATVDAIAALPVADQEDYYAVLEGVDEDVDDEVEAIDEALSDDTLTSEATAALSDAKTQAQATQTKVKALLAALDANTTTTSQVAGDDEAGRRDCPEDRQGTRGSRRAPRESQEAPAAT